MNNEATLAPVQKLEVEVDRQLRVIRFGPDEKTLYGGGYDASIRRWDFSAEEPKELAALSGHRGWVDCLAVAARSNRLISADSWGQICSWRLDADPPQVAWKNEQAHDGWVRTLSLSADEKKIATAGRDKIVRVWSAEDGKLLHELAGHEEEVYSVAMHPDGESVVSGDLFGRVKHWDLTKGEAKGECVRELELEKMHYYDRDQDVAGLYVMRFHNDGKTLLCAGSDPTRAGRAFGVPVLRTIDWKTLKIEKTYSLGPDKDGFVYDLQWRPEGHFMIVTSGPPGAGKLMLLRPDEEQPFFTYDKMFNCHSLAVQQSSGRFVVAATNRRSQGNGAVRDKEGAYVGNSSPLYLFEPAAEEAESA